jgi:hypothetical protein
VLGAKYQDTSELPWVQGSAAVTAGRIDSELLHAGVHVGSYVIQETIAVGGGGAIYVAQPASGEPPRARVAIKVLLRELAASPRALSRFQREAEVVSLINHPNIVPVLESGSLPDGRPYIVMELVRGENLQSMLLRRGRLAPGEVLELLTPVCSALAAAHAAGVVHRDLKASNICVGNEGGVRVVKLIDFGIAKLVEPDAEQPGLTVRGTRLGTPYAMPPEQIRGETTVDERADIYSLGVLLYQMLTSSYPFLGSTPQEIERLHLEAIPPRPSRSAAVAPALETVVLRCLQKRPDARFSTVNELLAALQDAVADNPAAPPPGTSDERDAIAVCVDLRMLPGVAEGDALDDAFEAIMEEAEQTLRNAGLELPLVTGNVLLGTQLLPFEADARRDAQRSVVGLATGLARSLGYLAAANRGLEVNVSLHLGKALVGGTASAPQVAGGPIMHILDWTLGFGAGRRAGHARSARGPVGAV